MHSIRWIRNDSRGNLFYDHELLEVERTDGLLTQSGGNAVSSRTIPEATSAAHLNAYTINFLSQGASTLDARRASLGPVDINSPEFKAWFGDSKVVSEGGKPLVVYHGTHVRPTKDGSMMGDIEAFDRLFTTKFRQHSIDTVGSWFSTNVGNDGAAMYAGGGDGSMIYPVYLSIKNPHNTTFQLMLRRARLLANGEDDGRMIGKAEVDAYRKWLGDMGKDGIHITHDEGAPNGSTEFKNQDAWIALEPTQIKSAISNTGEFSGPNILESRAVREEGIPPGASRILSSAKYDTATYKGNPDFDAAKGGSIEAAKRFVLAQIARSTVSYAKHTFGRDAIYVAPHAIEASGKNKIPEALAAYYAEHANGILDTDIIQTVKAGHTNATMLERMMGRPEFDGRVIPNRKYILVDDVATGGGTLAELSDYIRMRDRRLSGRQK